MSKVKNESYFCVHGWMVNELKLKGTELQTFAIIHGFCQDGVSDFRGSVSYIADFTCTSRPAVTRALKSLCEKELLIKGVCKGETNHYTVNFERVTKLINTCNETLHHTCNETLHNNIDVDIIGRNKKESISGQAAKPRKANAQAAEIPTVEELTARFDNSKLAAVVCSWFEYKQERGDKPYTPMGMKSFLTTVERFVKNKGVRGVCQCIELTMGSGYQGVLWDKCEDTR